MPLEGAEAGSGDAMEEMLIMRVLKARCCPGRAWGSRDA